jgi:hypothetical protein
VRAEATTLPTVAVTAGTATSPASGGTVAPEPMETPATETAADTPDGETETLAVPVTGTGEPPVSTLAVAVDPSTPTATAGVPESPGPGVPGPESPLPPLPPLGPWVGGDESWAGGDGPVTPGVGACVTPEAGTPGTITAAAREPRLLVIRRALSEATLRPPRLARSLVAGSATSELSAAPTSAPKRLGGADGCTCDVPSATPGIRDSTPRSTSDGSEKTPFATISSGTSNAATAASAATSRRETESLFTVMCAPPGTKTAFSFRFTCRPFLETISTYAPNPVTQMGRARPPDE